MNNEDNNEENHAVDPQTLLVVFTRKEVMRAVQDMKQGLASGPSGCSSDIWKMYSTMGGHGRCRGQVKKFFANIAKICNIVVSGKGSEELRQMVTTGIVFPVGEGPRPIIVDDLIAKTCSKSLAHAMKTKNLLPEEMTRIQQAFNSCGLENIVFLTNQRWKTEVALASKWTFGTVSEV